MRLLSVNAIVGIHDTVICHSGGFAGIRDFGSVASAAGRMSAGAEDTELFVSLHEKVAALLEALIRNHGFIDGNKRTALASAAAMLTMNGWELDYDDAEAVALVVGVAIRDITFDGIVAWLREHSRER